MRAQRQRTAGEGAGARLDGDCAALDKIWAESAMAAVGENWGKSPIFHDYPLKFGRPGRGKMDFGKNDLGAN
jgi:hypothetical protein